MTEKEKMLAGEFYNTRDPELLDAYHRCRQLLREFLMSDSRDAAVRQDIISRLLGKVGENVWIEAPFFCDYGENISLGDNVFINFNCLLLDCNRIVIGDNVLIGAGVQICTATHPTLACERVVARGPDSAFPSGYMTRTYPVAIGNNVWIGGGAIIFPGVTIGDNTTIGAGSVVNKSIPPDSVAAGNPCKVMKTLGASKEQAVFPRG